MLQVQQLMSSVARACTVAIAALVLLSSAAFADGVAWQELTLDEALAQAAAEDRHVLVDVYATWCGPCHRQDAEVFPTAVVGEATEAFIAIKVDAEAGFGPDVVERYHVVGFPTVLILRPDGEELDRVFGFMPAEEFAGTVLNYLSGVGTIDELRTQVAAAPEDLALVFELGSREAVRGEYESATAFMDQVIAGDADNALGLRVQAHYILGKYMYLRGQENHDAAVEEFNTLIVHFPSTDEAEEAWFQRGLAEVRAGRQLAGYASWEAFIGHDPTSAGYYNSVAWSCFQEGENEHGIRVAQRGLVADPTASYLWDTLAELQFASGDQVGAVASIEQAVANDPEDPYYAEQLERFARAE